MDESIRLGRIFGLQIGVNWSLAIVFFLLSYTLQGSFAASVPGQPLAAYWAAAVAAVVIFYASLLAHEIGHALVARRLGVEVEGITLWLFGGVARLKGDAATPGAEARIAGVGPIVSLAVALVFGALAFGLDALGVTPLVPVAFLWLAATNVALALFNLVPAFPLDGGRILRAILWRRSGNRLKATHSAARAGRAFAVLLIAAGLLQLLLQNFTSGIWSVFLGWFLLGAARNEESQVVLGGAIRGVKVADVMSSELIVGPAWITVDEFLRTYAAPFRHSVFPVKSFEGELAGVVTLHNLAQVDPERRRSTRVSDVACALAEVPRARPEEPLAEILPRMSGGCSEGRVLVMDGADGGRLVGIVSPADVTRLLVVRGAPG
jgi:Zn-dependent protease